MAKRIKKKLPAKRKSKKSLSKHKANSKTIIKKSLPLPTEVKADIENSELHQEINTFIQRIESLDMSISMVMTLMTVMHKTVIDRYNTFLTKKGKPIRKNKKG